MALDISAFSYFMPLFGFLFVFVIAYALLDKTKALGENKFIIVLISFILAIIFVTASSTRQIIIKVLPWFAVLIVVLVLIALIIGASQQKLDAFMKPWVGWVFIILLIIVFLIATVIVFNPVIQPVLNEEPGASTALISIKNFLASEKFLGAILLLVIAVIASWVMTRKSG